MTRKAEEKARTLEFTPYEPDRRFLLEISFDGGEYQGWQIQPERPSVQETMQRVLTKLYGGQPIHLIGSSRTDAGVHAIGFAASFLAPVRPMIPMDRLFLALNRQLPPSIRIRNISEVPLQFHTRYDAMGKAYTYVFNLGVETPFAGRYSWQLRRPQDRDAVLAAIPHLTGTRDFASFVTERKEEEDTVRTIYSITMQDFGQYRALTFVGNGFLYKMVRSLVGTLEAVGRGRLTPEEVAVIRDAHDRTIAPETAPAKGLFLVKVFFNDAEREQFRLEQLPFFM